MTKTPLYIYTPSSFIYIYREREKINKRIYIIWILKILFLIFVDLELYYNLQIQNIRDKIIILLFILLFH